MSTSLFPGAIIPQPFKGFCENVVKNDGTIPMHPNCKTLEDYNNERNGHFELLTWEAFLKLQTEYYTTPFTEITEDQYNNMLECLPPLKWHDLNPRFNIFFCSEATCGAMHGAYVYDNLSKKYYCATICILMKDEDILTQLKTAF